MHVDFRATHVDGTYLPLVRNYYSRTSGVIPLLLPAFSPRDAKPLHCKADEGTATHADTDTRQRE